MFEMEGIEDGPASGINAALPLILAEAETLYGERKPGYEDVRVEFRDSGAPCVEFRPGGATIYVRSEISDTPREAFCECAHEVIHLLSPHYYGADVRTGSVLEEGLATHFQAKIYQEWPVPTTEPFNPPPEFEHYRQAWMLVESLLTLKPDAIREIRNVKATIGLIEEADIVTAVRGISPDLAKALVRPLETLKQELQQRGQDDKD